LGSNRSCYLELAHSLGLSLDELDTTFTLRDLRNGSDQPATSTPSPPPSTKSAAVYSSSGLDMFEEPLIEIATISSTTETVTPHMNNGSNFPTALIPPPKAADEAIWDVAQECSLLDFDDMNEIPAVFQPQLAAAIRARMPSVASRIDPAFPVASFQNTESSAMMSVNPVEPEDWSSSKDDIKDKDDSDPCCADGRTGNVKFHFCWPCDTTYCDRCWDVARPHRRRLQPTGGLPHEQTDPVVAKKIRSAFEANLTDREQAMLHIQDEDTGWFGAWNGEQDEMVFQDYGRYATMMAETSARERKVRYPALVSFVGQTGAGKSTLIRLLIELYSSTDKRLQVPVVGSTKHQDIPTSGDVHLYCDPKTSDGKHPVLNADCEGLDGGEREPMGARSRNKS
jgi:hypothetical protein